jgi:hypothetical protein
MGNVVRRRRNTVSRRPNIIMAQLSRQKFNIFIMN